MSSNPLAEMHADHRAWKSEHALWNDNVRAWEQELDVALAEVEKAKATICSQYHLLRTHSAAVKRYEQQFATHEHAIAQAAAGAQPEPICSSSDHEREAANHVELRYRHEQVKKRHYTLMAQCHLLLKALTPVPLD